MKLTAILHGIFEQARREYDFPSNPVDDVEPLRVVYDPDSYYFYEPDEVGALHRKAKDAQDGAIFLTAAFAGLRLGELVGLRFATSTSPARRSASWFGRSSRRPRDD